MRHINGFVRKFVRLATLTRADAIRHAHVPNTSCSRLRDNRRARRPVRQGSDESHAGAGAHGSATRRCFAQPCRGIGAGIARALASTGCAVTINYHKDRDAAESVAEAIKLAGGQAAVVAADVSDVTSLPWLLSQASGVYDKF